MKYWTRTTHNFNNETREWEYRKELGQDNDNELKSVLGIHALYSGRWQNINEIISENKQYYDQYHNDPWGCCHDQKAYSKEVVLNDLEIMEKLGWIKSR